MQNHVHRINTHLVTGPFKCSVMQWGVVSDFPEKSVTKMYNSILLALLAVGGCQISRKNHYVTLECPLSHGHISYNPLS